ncbi:energy-coupling factor ABC transporter ATP-binding protein [Pseudodesulfovibrio pelocollis]|uniref:energy-coupling factor ABC transporter ATP-binding protein n=1 Tax=Pseudodesulfovibrio pelocollis TaxID=3051432 RepID=UPI00255B1D69|nr:ABC transporter ATP-binding protein [Pseudodesulfovibrio sp. SB368]
MITVTDLDYVYPGGQGALDRVSLSIRPGTLVGLVGANGSGKSTLMALMAGLYTPTSGSITVDGCVNPGEGRAVRAVCRLVMQDADLQMLGATAEEDLLLGRARTDATVARARELARRFSLLPAWERPVQTLSWGMKRKVCLAAALLDDPRVLLLDEPFSGLDYPGMREMRGLLRESRAVGLTQVVSSHDLECFIDLVDQLVVLDTGRLALDGPPDAVLNHVRSHGVRPPCSWSAGQGVRSWDEESL